MKKFLKPKYISLLLIIVVLISFQVYFSTEIPKYMAKNINIGIIEEGVDSNVVEKMDENTYKLFLSKDENDVISSSYELNGDYYVLKSGFNKQKLDSVSKNIISSTIKTDNEKAIHAFIAKINNNVDNNKSLSYITITSMKMLGFALSGMIFVILVSFFVSYLVALIVKNLRKDLFVKIENFSSNTIEHFGISTLITRTTSDFQKIQNPLGFVLKFLFQAPLTLAIAAIQAYLIAPDLIWIIVVLSIILIASMLVISIFGLPQIEKRQKLVDKLNNITREILTGKRVIRAFNKQNYETNKFEVVNDDSKKVNILINIIFSFFNPVATFILNISTVIIIYYVARIINVSNIGIGSVMAFIQYSIQILVSFLMLAGVFFTIPNMLISYKRINEVLNQEEIIKDNGTLDLKKINTIEFKDVSFGYANSDSYVLQDINFKLDKGSSLGIIGSTGSGKSTISKLLLRFADVSKGNILINGLDIREFTLKSLRDRLSYTPQIAKLFNGTILENIAYNVKDPDLVRVNDAIEKACASEFAQLDRDLNQSGTNLSGGQKQRIQIARSLYKDADVLIFDDSFSALDNKTDKKIRENLKDNDQIKVVISQKVLTIKDFDNILVLNNGEIVGYGNHDYLIDNCEIYAEIYNTQKGGTFDE